MNLAFITACCYPTVERVHMMMGSAEYCGIEVLPYGVGTDGYKGWGCIKGTMMLEALRRHRAQGFTHVLYTDGIDSLFVAPRAEITAKYSRLGSPPILMSGEKNCYPYGNLASHFRHESPFRYPCAGQFMGEIDWIIPRLMEIQDRYRSEDNDQAWWAQGVVDGGLDGFQIDAWCEVFQNMNAVLGKELTVKNGRVTNMVTGTRPCVLHFSGGFADPQTGRDSLMTPFWEELTK